MKCLVLSWGPESCQRSLLKSSILFINNSSIVFRSTFAYLQPLLATYALKWKDYHLTLISIRYLGCFVPVLCNLGKSIKVLINQNPANRNTNTGKTNKIILSGSRGLSHEQS